jgi:hypothetical protein
MLRGKVNVGVNSQRGAGQQRLADLLAERERLQVQLWADCDQRVPEAPRLNLKRIECPSHGIICGELSHLLEVHVPETLPGLTSHVGVGRS